MKTTRISLLGLMALATFACSKSDDSPKEDPVNQAPAAFELSEAADGADGVDVLPTLSWNAATDPDGDTVSYDVFLDMASDPSTLWSGGVSGTSATGTDRLQLLTDYNWKVVAKDAEGASTTSTSIFGFTTRGLSAGTAAANAAAEFSPRRAHSSVAFDGKLWVIGGNDAIGFREDIWSSTDGTTWSLVTATPGFIGRSSHASVVFQNQVWVIGGTSIRDLVPGPGEEQYYMEDVWSSADGTTWTELTAAAAFGVRDGMTAAVFNDELFVIGGYNGTGYMNDVWSTTDGSTWTEVTAAAAFPARSGHATVVFDNKIWVIGGWNGSNNYSDVWSSTDGVTWTEETGTAPFTSPVNMTVNVFDDKLWAIGGFSTTPVNDIWYSVDGITWEASTPEAAFSARSDHSTTIFNDKIWLIGGYDTELKNDVWALD